MMSVNYINVYFLPHLSLLSAARSNTAALWGLKAMTKHDIWLQYVALVLFCPCKYKSYIVKVSWIVEQPLIMTSFEQQQHNANIMS